jgi:two-component system sensor histidine kinase MtrB
VVNEKIKAALSESTLAVYSAQFRFTGGGVTDAALKKIAQEVVNAKKAIRATESGREVILIRSAKNLDPEVAIDTVSNRVSYESIPSELRVRLLDSGDPVWARSIIQYADGHKVPGIVVGDKLSIPRVGPYDIYFLFSFESQVNTLNLVKNYLFLAGFILLLLIVGITWLVVRQVIDPVRDAAKIAEEFTAGELEKRMSVVGSDEISRLGISFNAMANSIEQQIKRLENLSKVQQRFVSDVSHELRTPLTTIRMASDLIYAYRDKFEPNISRSAELLQSQIDRFELLLADLLEVSRFDATEAAMEMS